MDIFKGISVQENPEPSKNNQEINEQKLCEKLTIVPESFIADEWKKCFEECIKDKKRWSYSNITKTIYALCMDYEDNESEKKPFLSDIICLNIEKIRNEENILLVKFIDHVDLTICQYRQLSQLDKKISNLDQKASDIKKDIVSTTKDLTAQLVGLISIFTALSFLLFGSISMLDNLLRNVQETPILKIIILGAIWSLCIMNMFFLFVKLISRIADDKKIIPCPQALSNGVLATVFLIAIGIYIIMNYSFYEENIYRALINKKISLSIIVMITILIITLWCLIYGFRKKKAKSNSFI